MRVFTVPIKTSFVQGISVGVPQNPRVPPAQSRGYARSYKSATIDSLFLSRIPANNVARLCPKSI